MRSRKSRNDFRYSANIIMWCFPKAGWQLWKITIYAPGPKRKMVSTNAIIQPVNPDWITWNIQKFPHSFHKWGVFRKQLIAGKRCSCLLFCCRVLVRSQHRAGFRITFGFVLALEPWWSTSFLPQSNLRFLFVLAQLCLFCNGISPGIDLDSLDCGLVSLNVSQESPWRLTEHYNPPLCNDCKIIIKIIMQQNAKNKLD